MVKLTPELINSASQRINPIRDRELNLRGFKIPLIENLGATLNQFDTIDFSDNDIRKLDNFPLLPRLKNVFVNNNRIVRLSPTLSSSLPNLESLILTNNMLSDLSEIDNLIKLENLKNLSFLFNPVSTKEFYRAYVIYKLPQVKVLDFKRIRDKDREESKNFFKTKKGKEIRKEIMRSLVVEDDDDEDGGGDGGGVVVGVRRGQLLSEKTEQVNAKIKEAIKNAGTLEEIERLNLMLRDGRVPEFNEEMEQ